MYLIRLALRPWRRTPFSQALSALAVSLLLLVGGGLAGVEFAMSPLLQRLRTEQLVTVYLKAPGESAPAPEEIVDKLKSSLGAKAKRPVEAHYYEPEQFLGELKKSSPELSAQLEDLGREMPDLLPRSVAIKGEFEPSEMDDALEAARAIEGVESVESTRDRYAPTARALVGMRWLVRGMIVAVALALLTGLVLLARVNAAMHSDAIDLMRLLGAGFWRTRLPAVLSAVSVGVLGGLVAALAWMGWAPQALRALKAISPVFADVLMPGRLIAGAAFVLAGAAAGLVSAAFGKVKGP